MMLSFGLQRAVNKDSELSVMPLKQNHFYLDTGIHCLKSVIFHPMASHKTAIFLLQERNFLVRTIKDCWDHHPEARLTASTVLNRLKRIWPAPDADDYSEAPKRQVTQQPEQSEPPLPIHVDPGKDVDEDSFAKELVFSSPESSGIVEHSDPRHRQLHDSDHDSGVATSGQTTDPESSTGRDWHDCPPRSYHNKFPQLLKNGRLQMITADESSASMSSDVTPKRRLPHSPRVHVSSQRSRVDSEGSSVWETSCGYEAQRSSCESSTSDAAISIIKRPVPKGMPAMSCKLPSSQSSDLQSVAREYSESSI